LICLVAFVCISPKLALAAESLTFGGVYHLTHADGTQTDVIDAGLGSNLANLSGLTLSVTGPGFSYTFGDSDIYRQVGGNLAVRKEYPSGLPTGIYTFILTDGIGTLLSTRIDNHANPHLLPVVISNTVQSQRLSTGGYRFSWEAADSSVGVYYRMRIQLADGSATPVYVGQLSANTYDEVSLGILVDNTAYEVRVEVSDGPNWDVMFNHSTSSFTPFVPTQTDFDANRLILGFVNVHNRAESGGAATTAAEFSVNFPDTVSLVVLNGPNNFSYTFDLINDRVGNNFFKLFSQQLSAGRYSFRIMANGVEHSAYAILTIQPVLPGPDPTTMQVLDLGNGSIRFSWAGVAYTGALYYRVVLRDSTTSQTILTSDWANKGFVDLPKNLLGNLATRQWRIEIADSPSLSGIQNYSNGPFIDTAVLPVDPNRPSFSNVILANLTNSNGSISTLSAANATASGVLSELKIDGPSGFHRNLLAAHFSNMNDAYTDETPTSPSEGLYTFTAINSYTNTVARTYRYQSSPHPLPPVSATTFKTEPGPNNVGTRLSWAPIASDVPIWYRVQIGHINDYNNDGLTDHFIGVEADYITQSNSVIFPLPVRFLNVAVITIKAVDGSDYSVINNMSRPVSFKYATTDYTAIVDADGDGYAGNNSFDTTDNDPAVFPFSIAPATAVITTGTSPANGATSVLLLSPITISFSRIIDQRTLPGAVTLSYMSQGVPTSVPGTVNYTASFISSNRKSLFIPTEPLLAGLTYTLNVSSSVKDIFGNSLTPFSNSFTTTGTADTSPPVISFTTDILSAYPDATVPFTLKFTDPEGSKITGYCVSEKNTSNDCVWSPVFSLFDSSAGAYYDGVSSNHTFPGIPVAVASQQTLYFYAKDIYGNIGSAFRTTTITIPDTVAPTLVMTAPPNSSSQTAVEEIAASALDNVAVSSVTFSVRTVLPNGTNFYLNDTANGFIPTTTPVWISASFDNLRNAWIIDTSGIFSWAQSNYVVTVKATDTSNNTSTITSQFSFVSTIVKSFSTLTLDSGSKVQNGGTLTVGGKLSRPCSSACSMINLQNRNIKLTIKKDNIEVIGSPVTVATSNIDGNYSATLTGLFSLTGSYTVQATYNGDTDLDISTSTIKSVLVGKPAGYAVIVVGRLNGDPGGIPSHNKSARRIYKTLKERNFTDDNIYWFNQGAAYDPARNNETMPVDDPTPNVDKIGKIINGTALFSNGKTLADLMKADPAPLYLIMVDHGSKDASGQGEFFVGNGISNEIITPTDLNSWLTTLDGKLDQEALNENKIIVIGACYSGSFITKPLSASGRIIITSASSSEQSYRGGYDGQDSVQSGEYFLDEFFASLKRFKTIKESFRNAAEKTWHFTRKNHNSSSNSAAPVSNAMQHPMLDDDGNGIGSMILSDADNGDGVVSNAIKLGASVGVNSIDNPADLKDVADTIFLSSTDTALPLDKPLWAKAFSNSDVSSVWVELVRPSVTLSLTTDTGQQSRPLSDAAQIMTGTNTRFELGQLPNSPFGTSSSGYGKYEAYYYAIDAATGSPSPSKRTVIYKDNPSITSFPSAASLLEPDANGKVPDMSSPGSWVDPITTIFFKWSPVIDANITYRLEICADNMFTTGCIVRDELTDPGYLLTADMGLTANIPYFWRVLTVSAFGKRSYSEIRNFTPNNTNPDFPVMVKIVVTANDGTPGGTPIPNATVMLGSTTLTTITSGVCLASVLSGTYNLDVNAGPNFLPQNISISPSSGVLVVNVSLTPTPTLQVSTDGAGTGTVNCSMNNVSVTCNGTFSLNDNVTIHATPDWKSLLLWGGDCSGLMVVDCSLLMTSGKYVTATFIPNYQARIVSPPYSSGSLQSALNSASNGATVEAMDYYFLEPILFDRSGFEVTIDGGRGPAYSLPATGYSSVQGSFRIKQGTIKIKGPLAVW